MKGHFKRHIVSCPEDTAIWAPLAREGIPVYKPEFVFSAAMKQEVYWDDEAERVDGSLL
jgi:mediator of DNA damage checkpoint protein 1